MKRVFLIAATLAALQSPLRAADTTEEEQIAILQSTASPQQKDAACAQLKRIGTARSVPALATLLAHEQLSHSGRYALESMPALEAGRALTDALDKTTGLTKTGIIISLGNRRDTAALPALAKLVRDSNPLVASAAAVALGKIGGSRATQALNAARLTAPAEIQPALTDGLLRCAAQILANGNKAAASAIYRQFLESKEPRSRTAAWRGLILSAGKDAASLARRALSEDDRAARFAALQLVAEIPGTAATKTFAEALPSILPDTQVAMIEALERRGDAAAIPALVSMTKASSEAARIAALHALAVLGGSSVVPTLVEAAAAAKGAEQEAARNALDRIRGKGIADTMLALLAKTTPEVQTELILALGRRREMSAVPMLLKLAGSSGESQRAASLRSLALTADEIVASDLVRLLTNASTDTGRDAVEKTLLTICSRSKHSEVCAAPVLKAVKSAAIPARCALLRVLGRIAGSDALQELRTATRDKDSAIQDAAIRSLADAGRLDAMPDLLALAKDAPTLPHRVLALRGYWRAVALADKHPTAARLKMCEAGFAASQRPEEKKLGLIELAKLPDADAIKMAESFLADDAVRAEAGMAIVQVAREISGANRKAAKAALAILLATSPDANVREAAEAALNQIEPGAGYITTWLVAGPYTEAGKNYRALFDVPFPPEQPDAKQVKWRALPAGTSADKPWLLDLLKFPGGEQCAAYVRTNIYSDKPQPARLDIGSDDGVKVWLNGAMVHANNTARPITPGSDKAAVTLKQGWNTLLLKITQNNLGWEFCVRVVKPDGMPLIGLRAETSPAP
ncbi:MAG: HEAT repeat domain-containing protein [Verrucomicrobia bacterium]|nr:HEAT repeat domain-containing protein [Verrucomicrobiota bacterium]